MIAMAFRDIHAFVMCSTATVGAGLIEFPISTIRLAGVNIPIAGGGYFRLFPYALISMGAQAHHEQERQPVVVYLHPWEIDANSLGFTRVRLRDSVSMSIWKRPKEGLLVCCRISASGLCPQF